MTFTFNTHLIEAVWKLENTNV